MWCCRAWIGIGSFEEEGDQQSEGCRIKDCTWAQGWLYLQQVFSAARMQAFANQLSKYSHVELNITTEFNSLTYGAALHDAVMLYAFAATKVLAAGGNLANSTLVTEAMRNTTFQGVAGGMVDLDVNGDPILSYELMNYLGGTDGAIPVGLYQADLGQYQPYEQAIVWPGSTTAVPVDFSSGVLLLELQLLRIVMALDGVHCLLCAA